MKLRKKFKLGLGAFTLSAFLALAPSCTQKEEVIEAQVQEQKIEDSKEVLPIEKELREFHVKELKKYDEIYLSAKPEGKTGQNLDVWSTTFDFKKKYFEVERVKLYEDDKLIAERLGRAEGLEGISLTVEHKTPGTHNYLVEYVYKNGGSRKTETKTVEFTGEILDIAPESPDIYVYGNELVLKANDYGDNKGIKTVKLYEDGELWKTIDPKPIANSKSWCLETVSLDLGRITGKHKYFAKFIDNGENVAVTDTIVINYD